MLNFNLFYFVLNFYGVFLCRYKENSIARYLSKLDK